jgi:RNA polymerase sigma factor (sigma-70 family)
MKKQTAQAALFEALIKPHITPLYKTAYRLVGKREAAEDLVQEVLVKLYPKTAEMEKIEALGPWLRKVLYRQFIDEWRKKTRRPEIQLSEVTGEIARIKHPDDGPEKMTERIQIRENLQEALNALDDRHRLVVILHMVEGYTLNEMAEIYNVSSETLKTQLRRAKARLKNYLKM